MPNYDFVCECGTTIESVMSVKDSRKGIKCACGRMMKRVFPGPAVRIDYSDIRHFGKPQYADARRRACGMTGEVPPDTFHKDDIQ